MTVETDAVLVVFWRWAEMVLRWRRPVGRSMCERRRQGRRDVQQQAVWQQERVDRQMKKTAVFVETVCRMSAIGVNCLGYCAASPWRDRHKSARWSSK